MGGPELTHFYTYNDEIKLGPCTCLILWVLFSERNKEKLKWLTSKV